MVQFLVGALHLVAKNPKSKIETLLQQIKSRLLKWSVSNKQQNGLVVCVSSSSINRMMCLQLIHTHTCFNFYFGIILDIGKGADSYREFLYTFPQISPNVNIYYLLKIFLSLSFFLNRLTVVTD